MYKDNVLHPHELPTEWPVWKTATIVLALKAFTAPSWLIAFSIIAILCMWVRAYDRKSLEHKVRILTPKEPPRQQV